MSLAQLKASLVYWRRALDTARYWLKRARKDAVSGAGAATPGVVTAEEAKRIKRWEARVAHCEAMIRRREEQIEAKGGKPKIITSRQLGLTFQNVFGAKGTPTRGTGHYTAGHRSAGPVALAAEMRADHAFHKSKGWGGLSYEVMIADDGTIGFGNPISRKSAAVASTNSNMVNICCPGTTGDRITNGQERSIRWLRANWHTSAVPSAYRLPASMAGLTWKGHHEWPAQSTACPGAMLPDYHRILP